MNNSYIDRLSLHLDEVKSMSAVGQLKALYLEMLEAALCVWLGSDMGFRRFSDVSNWLASTDFFTAPASTRFHESHAEGLVEHSLKVVVRVNELLEAPTFSSMQSGIVGRVSKAQAVLCALLHDICKCNFYESYQKNVKNEVTKSWETVTSWKIKENRDIFLGHGEYSAIQALRLIPEFTDEMLTAIRWHMGLWDCSNSAQQDFAQACHKYPLVHLIQFADLLSIVDY